jgi:hypothetical protein
MVMAGVDLTRYISFAALAVSLGGAIVSILSYRRSGHRARALLGTQVSSVDGSADVVSGTLSLVNGGQGSVQIVGFAFLFDDSAVLCNLDARSYTGPGLPMRLDGLHTVQWTFPYDDGVWLVDQIDPRPKTVRGIVILGSGKEIKTSRLTVAVWLSTTSHPTGSGRRRSGRSESVFSRNEANSEPSSDRGPSREPESSTQRHGDSATEPG